MIGKKPALLTRAAEELIDLGRQGPFEHPPGALKGQLFERAVTTAVG